MMYTDAMRRRAVEECLADPENRVFLERIVCKAIKNGGKFPTSDDIFRIADMLQAKTPDEGQAKFNPNEQLIAIAVIQGLNCLAQLCVVSERM